MNDAVIEAINSLMIINPSLLLVLVALMVCRVEHGGGGEGRGSYTAVTKWWHVGGSSRQPVQREENKP